ncbi:MAG: epoxyqueuosine reductase [Clostridiales bacterium]|nr:epoxyqueuosine reductase [Clostridiales bacterium]
MSVRERIGKYLDNNLISDYGFTTLEDGVCGLRGAVSIVVRLSDAIMDEISEGPTHTYFYHYRQVNAFIDQILLGIGFILQDEGYRYMPVAASQSVSDDGYSGVYSHKKAAHLAGLGSIGRSNLFISRKYGARVRLGTVLTDCLFVHPLMLEEDMCSDCMECVKNCPAGAIKGGAWTGLREDIFAPNLCSDYMKREYRLIGRGSVCGRCICKGKNIKY